jgi:hypothetical protein
MNEDAMVCPTCGQWSDEQDEHEQTRKELEELQDAIYECLAPPETASDSDSHVIIASFGEEGFSDINKAIESSKRRRGDAKPNT